MTHARLIASSLLTSTLALGCLIDIPGNDTQTTTTTTTSTTTGQQSGSVTSAPGSVADGTTGDSVPTMATASTTGPGTSGSTGEPCSFLHCDDMYKNLFECDVWAQDCPEGQKCAAYSADGGGWNGNKCVDVTGSDKPGELCTSEDWTSGVDSCIKGAMCWAVNEEGVGFCRAQCIGSAEAPACEGAGECAIAAGGALTLCFLVCDPLLQDCVGTDLCVWLDWNFNCVVDAGGAEGQANDPCEFANVCDSGLVCLEPGTVSASCDPAAGGCCTPFCQFPDGACPNPDQVCVQWFDPMMLPENDPQLDIGFCGVSM